MKKNVLLYSILAVFVLIAITIIAIMLGKQSTQEFTTGLLTDRIIVPVSNNRSFQLHSSLNRSIAYIDCLECELLNDSFKTNLKNFSIQVLSPEHTTLWLDPGDETIDKYSSIGIDIFYYPKGDHCDIEFRPPSEHYLPYRFSINSSKSPALLVRKLGDYSSVPIAELSSTRVQTISGSSILALKISQDANLTVPLFDGPLSAPFGKIFVKEATIQSWDFGNLKSPSFDKMPKTSISIPNAQNVECAVNLAFSQSMFEVKLRGKSNTIELGSQIISHSQLDWIRENLLPFITASAVVVMSTCAILTYLFRRKQ